MIFVFAAVAWGLSAFTHAVSVIERHPIPVIYHNATSKLRIKGTGFPSSPEAIRFAFDPPMDPGSYSFDFINNTFLAVELSGHNAWPMHPNMNDKGSPLNLTEYYDMSPEGGNQLEAAVQMAFVIETPSVMQGGDTLLYMNETKNLIINGTGFRPDATRLGFDPSLKQGVDYRLLVKSATCLQLSLRMGKQWRSEPGPLKLKFIDTGGGWLRIDAQEGGALVAEVQANLGGAHGVTIDTTVLPIYQSQQYLTLSGSGFSENMWKNSIRWANGLRGKSINYTITGASESALILKLTPGSKWRGNPANLPGPLTVLAVASGAGFVPVGETALKKGRKVALVYADPKVTANEEKIFQSHTHELWITGTGFTQSSTRVRFDPRLELGVDYSLMVFNSTHLRATLIDGMKWAPAPGKLRVTEIDTGAGTVAIMPIVVVAQVVLDAADHPSGITVTPSGKQMLYQTAFTNTTLVVTGASFCENPDLVFEPSVEAGVDYELSKATPSRLELSLKSEKQWCAVKGDLYLKSIKCPGTDGAVELANGQGIVVAQVLEDPVVTPAELHIYVTHTKQLHIKGSGFVSAVVQTPNIVLRPTPQSAYDVISALSDEIVLQLREGQSWVPMTSGAEQKTSIFVMSIDAGAGEVKFHKGVEVAVASADPEGVICDDTCPLAFDGSCDDMTFDIGINANNAVDDDIDMYQEFTEYPYYYADDYSTDWPLCDVGTDCTDCAQISVDDVGVRESPEEFDADAWDDVLWYDDDGYYGYGDPYDDDRRIVAKIQSTPQSSSSLKSLHEDPGAGECVSSKCR